VSRIVSRGRGQPASGAWLGCAVLAMAALACCVIGEPPSADDGQAAIPSLAATDLPSESESAWDATYDKWALWTNGTQLRGADVYQRRVYVELDGSEFMGPGPVGPPYTEADFDRLASWGANYVNISHPGLFSEGPPYELDERMEANLDRLLDLIARADMFAVISFRTGPGRSEFGLCCLEEAGDWYDVGYLNDEIWRDEAAQAAWAAMWRHTAERYRGNSVVVGYDLMVEPNANEVWGDIWDPKTFYQEYEDSSYDWNRLFPQVTDAIREVDAETPILVGGMAYSAVDWMPYIRPSDDRRTVYVFHQYAPYQYTHQWPDDLALRYPDTFDADWDGEDDRFDRDWLDELLTAVDRFAGGHDVPVAVNEFGVVRWVPGASRFMEDQMALFEQRGLNYALWVWDPEWAPYVEENNAFNLRLGPDPENDVNVPNDLMGVVQTYWGRNTVRPSTFGVDEP